MHVCVYILCYGFLSQTRLLVCHTSLTGCMKRKGSSGLQTQVMFTKPFQSSIPKTESVSIYKDKGLIELERQSTHFVRSEYQCLT